MIFVQRSYVIFCLKRLHDFSHSLPHSRGGMTFLCGEVACYFCVEGLRDFFVWKLLDFFLEKLHNFLCREVACFVVVVRLSDFCC